MMVTLDKLRTYQRDFLAFAADIAIRSGGTAARFGDVMAEFQQEALRGLGPCGSMP